MNKRKETPDVLTEILGGEIPTPPEGESPPAPAKPKRARAPRKPSASRWKPKSPDKWDYRVVSFQEYKGWRPRFIDGKAVRDWTDGPLMHEYLSGMGEEGWELTTASSGERLFGRSDKYQLYFKRPK